MPDFPAQSPVPAPGDPVRRQLDGLRNKLLDLTLNNRMLNLRPSRRVGLAVVGESSAEVHRILVEEGRRMSFAGVAPERPARQTDLTLDDQVAETLFRQQAEDELAAALERPNLPPSLTDRVLQTPDNSDLLPAKLRTIAREARLAEEELGIDTLFLTLGALEWTDGGERTFRAPLLFVPVQLVRTERGDHRLEHAGGDVGDNLPLRAKLREFGLDLPTFRDDQTVAGYHGEVESTIRDQARWAVHPDEIHLGFFNYEKYAMYVDLGGEAWSDDAKPWDHPDLRALLAEGYPEDAGDAGGRLPEDGSVDVPRPVDSAYEVFDADSSQTTALIRARERLSMVVEGPPGTGKSQTITNLIAEAVADGRTVLFVSAKRAALEVVRRKLNEAQLGDLLLDLHDKGANRKAFYAELRRTTEVHLEIPDATVLDDQLAELRDRLNRHAEDVNAPIPGAGETPFDAMAALAALPAETEADIAGRIPAEAFAGVDVARIRVARPDVEALRLRLAALGVLPIDHPLRGTGYRMVDPTFELDLRQALGRAAESLAEARAAWDDACRALRIPLPCTAGNHATLAACVRRALDAPRLDGVAVLADTWRQEAPAVRTSIAALRLRLQRRAEVEALAEPGIWASDPAVLHAVYVRYGDRWTRWFFGAFRRARTELRRHLRPGAPADPAGQRGLLAKAVEALECERTARALGPALDRLFGAQHHGLESEPEDLERILEWVLSLTADVESGRIPAGLRDLFTAAYDREDLRRRADDATAAGLAAIAADDAACRLLGFDPGPAEGRDLAAAAARIDAWREAMPHLAAHLQYRLSRQAVVDRGFPAVAEVADRWPLAAERLTTAFERSFHLTVLRRAIAERPALGAFERLGHEAAAADFATLDDAKLRANRNHVRRIHQRQMPRLTSAAGNLGLLRTQCQLTRGHKPIRWIMRHAGPAIQRIKPVFMMSPLSAAIHLPPELPPFDLVVFDEASQIRPEDALCAIARARQVVVVGDTRQMPPTSFFDRVADEEVGDDEETDGAPLDPALQRLESILSLMNSAVAGRRRRPDLRWHYRSVHPDLIQPSNELFYENRLIVFPSPGAHDGRGRVGLVWHHSEAFRYEAGATNRVNRTEATAVADRVVRHLADSPGESLLIAAMNKPQADLIDQELQIRERRAPDLFQAYARRHPNEPLAVKNLETIQGDERDVVFVSVTYGRDASGMLRQTFGPILQEGGDRRLNVLFTRARRRCEVFSGIRADDIRPQAGRRGLLVFRQYLQFAERGVLEAPAPTGGEAESPFEAQVAAALAQAGYEAHAQVGAAGYRIDLGVVDPNRPGRYVLGVECDGAAYHSARSARDRDKLRQRVLEARGWRIHRIWSTDWWRSRDAEVERLVAAVQAAIADATEPPPGPSDPPEPSSAPPGIPPSVALPDLEVRSAPTAADGGRLVDVFPAYVPCVPSTEPQTWEGWVAHIRGIIEAEGPITHAHLLLRLRKAAGVGRVGRRIREALDQLIAAATAGLPDVGDAYVGYPAQAGLARDWSALPNDERKFAHVSDVELGAALVQVVRRSFGIAGGEAAKEAVRRLGFSPVARHLERADAVLARLREGGRVAAGPGGTLTIPETGP